MQRASHSPSLDALQRKSIEGGRKSIQGASHSPSLDALSSLLQVVSRPAEACHRLATHKKINTHYLPAWIIGCRRFAASDIGSLWLPLCQVYIATHTHTHTRTHTHTHTHTHTQTFRYTDVGDQWLPLSNKPPYSTQRINLLPSLCRLRALSSLAAAAAEKG